METLGMVVLLMVGGLVGAGYLFYLSVYYSPNAIAIRAGKRIGDKMRGK